MTPTHAQAAAVALRARAVGWAQSFGLSDDAAEDVAHDAIAAMLQKAASIEPASALPWLRTAVLHKARDHVASRRRLLLVEPPEQACDAPDAERTLVSQQLSEEVRRALERVPASRRRVLVAVEGEGRSLAVVAREEGIPESTARVRLRDGAEDLRAELVRQRAAERRRTGGFSSWAMTWVLADVRAWGRKASIALGALAAGGALLIPMVLPVADEPLAPIVEEMPAAPFEAAPVSWPVNEAWAAREAGREEPVRMRTRHDAGQRFRAERFGVR